MSLIWRVSPHLQLSGGIPGTSQLEPPIVCCLQLKVTVKTWLPVWRSTLFPRADRRRQQLRCLFVVKYNAFWERNASHNLQFPPQGFSAVKGYWMTDDLFSALSLNATRQTCSQASRHRVNFLMQAIILLRQEISDSWDAVFNLQAPGSKHVVNMQETPCVNMFTSSLAPWLCCDGQCTAAFSPFLRNNKGKEVGQALFNNIYI